MEAKDAIMSKDYMKTLILAKHCSPETTARDIVITDIEQDLVNEQAEFSFKAGQEDVVDWGLETCPHDLFGEGTHCFKRACDECWKEKWHKSPSGVEE